jgi:hypothetical protein
MQERIAIAIAEADLFKGCWPLVQDKARYLKMAGAVMKEVGNEN